ncbi:MAG: hypothetical protein GX236_07845 [Clostridiaceae bacterium]|jgi:hypothetical protein|nr:hypothetical protein [Clostridiaceae bacterium]
MKNIKIPGFPPPEQQDMLRFYILKSLSYTTRMIVYLSCIVVGFIIQIITVTAWPGALLLIFAAMLNLLKGYNSMPNQRLNHDDNNWTKTTMEKVRLISQFKEKINKWDRDALDISNRLGCFTFGCVVFLLYFLFIIVESGLGGVRAASIFFADSFILILPLWFNGMKKKGHQNILYIKTDLIIALEEYFETIKKDGENFVPSLILSKDTSGNNFPTNCRFNIVFDNAPDGFYGIQAQININVVDRSYPYFYCVITAKEGFGLDRYTTRFVIPKGITLQYSKDKEAEVIVIRQRTTKNSGYHTKISACKNILEFTLGIARLVLE